MNKENFEGDDLEITQEFVKGSFRTEALINEEDISSFLSAVPNNLGINLCSLETVDFIAENDEFGQLVSLKLNFRPMSDYDKAEERLKNFRINHGFSWAEWIKKTNKNIMFNSCKDKLLDSIMTADKEISQRENKLN